MMKRRRADAVRVLFRAGWTVAEIAYAIRWKIGAVERVISGGVHLGEK